MFKHNDNFESDLYDFILSNEEYFENNANFIRIALIID